MELNQVDNHSNTPYLSLDNVVAANRMEQKGRSMHAPGRAVGQGVLRKQQAA